MSGSVMRRLLAGTFLLIFAGGASAQDFDFKRGRLEHLAPTSEPAVTRRS